MSYYTNIICLTVAVFIVSILLVFSKWDNKSPTITGCGRKQIAVDFGDEVVKVDSNILVVELSNMKQLLKKYAGAAGPSCSDLSPKIKNAMIAINRFIKANPPEHTKAVCNLDLSADIVNQQMSLSVTPDDRDIEMAYNTILDHEQTEREIPSDPEKLLTYLLVNIDVVIKMLCFDLCQSGLLNLKKLYEILGEMNKKVCQLGIDHDTKSSQIYTEQFPLYAMRLKKYTKYDQPPNLPLFIKEGPIMEPFQDRPSMVRTKKSIGSGLGNKSVMYSSDSKPASNSKKTLDGFTDRTGPFEKLVMYDETPVSLSRFPVVKKPVQNAAPLPPISKGYLTYDTYNQQNVYTPACDTSFEGSIGCDILGYKPPGHIISQLYDKSEHYTVNENSCASNTTLPRETATCYLEDVAMRNALDGQPEQMLDCVGDCYREPNYFRWYHKMNTATKDMEFILNPEE